MGYDALAWNVTVHGRIPKPVHLFILISILYIFKKQRILTSVCWASSSQRRSWWSWRPSRQRPAARRSPSLLRVGARPSAFCPAADGRCQVSQTTARMLTLRGASTLSSSFMDCCLYFVVGHTKTRAKVATQDCKQYTRLTLVMDESSNAHELVSTPLRIPTFFHMHND